MESVTAEFASELTIHSQPRAPTHHAPPSIHVTIHYAVTHRDIYRSPVDGTLNVLRQYTAEPTRSLRDCLGTLETMRTDPRGLCTSVARILAGIGVPDWYDHGHLIRLLASQIRELAPPVRLTSEELHLEWTVERVESRVVVLEMEELWQGNDDDDDCGMVPTAPEALAGLAPVECGDNECVICFDELVVDDGGGGKAAAAMPCGHVFHEGCIVAWLKTSHYCPICRFEMPKAAEEDCGLVGDEFSLSD